MGVVLTILALIYLLLVDLMQHKRLDELENEITFLRIELLNGRNKK